MCVHVRVCVYVYACVCPCVHMCAYICAHVRAHPVLTQEVHFLLCIMTKQVWKPLPQTAAGQVTFSHSVRIFRSELCQLFGGQGRAH